MKRVKYIDVARGIAIICIVLGHMGRSNINRVVFTFHVPIFFLISGYFTRINPEAASYKKYLYHKVRTLLVPYGVTCACIIFFALLFGKIFHEDGMQSILKKWLLASAYGAGDAYTQPFVIYSIGAIWFLWALFWASLFLYGILKLPEKARIFVVLLLFAAGYYSRQKLFWFPLSIQGGCCCLLYMYIGYLWKGIRASYEKTAPEIRLAVGAFSLIVWLYFMRDFKSFWLVHCDIGRGPVDVFGSLCGCWCVINLSKWIEGRCRLLTRALSFMGRNSLIVLCAHIIELNTFPWHRMVPKILALGFPVSLELYVKIGLKFLWIIPVTVICEHYTRVLTEVIDKI